MLHLVQECAPWLNWKTVGMVALVAVGLILCTGIPIAVVLAGVAPVLLIIACLLPCLAPLLLLRRKQPSASPQSSGPLAAWTEPGTTSGQREQQPAAAGRR